ncbi:MAG: hybrid sensor histidine kinase/response regulator [Caldilineaceae bacterium]
MKRVELNAEEKSGKIPRILLIDDDPFSYETVEAQLFQDGYELLFRNNGFDAVKQVSSVAPDVILLDLMMPGVNGFEVCQQIKSTPQLEHIPIILFSALDGADNIAAGFAAGADGFLTKPISRAELRARVRSMLRIKQQYNNLQQILQQRETFSRVLLHDMRNPLTGIVLYTQLLQKRSELTAEQQQYLQLMQEEAQRLRLLFDQMQLLNKLQQQEQKIRWQLTDLRTLLSEVIAKYAPVADTKALILSANIPHTPVPQVAADRSLLHHLLDILVGQALRFAPTQTTVQLALTIVHTSSLWTKSNMVSALPAVQVAVTDQGPLLTTTVLDNIYEDVEQWDVLAPERPGLGVSLALCKMIAEIHEGHLAITSSSTDGATVAVALPISASEWAPHS